MGQGNCPTYDVKVGIFRRKINRLLVLGSDLEPIPKKGRGTVDGRGQGGADDPKRLTVANYFLGSFGRLGDQSGCRAGIGAVTFSRRPFK